MKASVSVVCEEAFVKESPTSSGNPFNCRAGRTLEEELQGEGTGEKRRASLHFQPIEIIQFRGLKTNVWLTVFLKACNAERKLGLNEP